MNWISVKDRLPEKGEYVLTITDSLEFYEVNCIMRKITENAQGEEVETKVWNKALGGTVTHWMPLPKPPKP